MSHLLHLLGLGLGFWLLGSLLFCAGFVAGTLFAAGRRSADAHDVEEQQAAAKSKDGGSGFSKHVA